MRKFLIILMSIGMAGGLFARDIENWSSTINGTAKVTTDDAGTATLTVDSIVADNTVNNSGSLTVTNAGGEGTITVYGGETNGASVTLKADNGDDAGDSWKAGVDTSENFIIQNDNSVKGTYATVVSIANSGATTIAGALDVDSITVNAGAGIDNQAEGTLLVGASTASKVEIADTGIETEIQGPLDVNGNADFDGTVAFAPTASADVTSNTFAVAAITTKSIVLKSLGENFTVVLPNASSVGQELRVQCSSAATTNAIVIADSGNVECGSDWTGGVNDVIEFWSQDGTNWICTGTKDND